MSRDQQQQDPPEQPEQLPEEAEQGRGDGGEGHLDQEGQVDQDHLGRCQPPLISVAATLRFHHHCFLPAEQEITGEREKSDFQITFFTLIGSPLNFALQLKNPQLTQRQAHQPRSQRARS